VADGTRASVGGAADRDAAFVRLADEHLDRAYWLARVILRDPHEGQDARHDARRPEIRALKAATEWW
jgi:DNA-directed RNA polymerase specialized sigma24 family protein